MLMNLYMVFRLWYNGSRVNLEGTRQISTTSSGRKARSGTFLGGSESLLLRYITLL